MKKILIVMLMMVGTTVNAQISLVNPIDEYYEMVEMSFNNYKSFEGYWGFAKEGKYTKKQPKETEYKPIIYNNIGGGSDKYNRVEKIYNCIKDLENDSISIEKLVDGFILHIDGKSYSITDGCLNHDEILLEINYINNFTIKPLNHK